MKRERVVELVKAEILRKKAIIKFLESEGENDLTKYHKEVIEALSTVLEFYKGVDL